MKSLFLSLSAVLLLFPLSCPAEQTPPSLFQAAEKGDLEVVKLLLAQKADVNMKDERGWTPLIFAAKGGQTETAKLLLQSGADVNLVSSQGCPPLFFACEEGHLDSALFLLDRGAKLDIIAKTGMTALSAAANNGMPEIIKALIAKGADPNFPPERKNDKGPLFYPLMMAANRGHIKAIEALLDAGADIEATDEGYATALIGAAHNRQVEAVKMLLSRGADPNHRQKRGGDALTEAEYSGNSELYAILTKAKERPGKAREDFTAELAQAAGEGSYEKVQALIYKGANVRRAGGEAAIGAVRAKNAEVLKVLLDKGAELKGYRNNNLTPLLIAANLGADDVVRLLLERGADINETNGEGWQPEVRPLEVHPDANSQWSPLHAAVQGNHLETVKILIEKGAKLDVRDGRGCTPLAYAENEFYTEVAELLKKAGATPVDPKGSKPPSPLFKAVHKGDAKRVRFLLDKGVNPNDRDERGDSPLSHTLKYGKYLPNQSEIIEILKKEGAQ